MTQDVVLGIDLGTSDSAAFGVDTKNYDPNVATKFTIPIKFGTEQLIFSSFAIRKDMRVELVGNKAHAKLKDPNFVVFENTKRAMGLSYKELVRDMPRSPEGMPLLTPFIEVVQHPDFPDKPMLKGVGVEDPRLVFAPEEVAAKILYYIIETAAKTTFHGKANIKAVVVTVPAYFSDQQRQATRAACEVAIALNELSSKVYIINEPTAALFAHWVNSGLKAGAAAIDFAEWLVVDIGGGTTDLSAVSVQLDQQDGHQRLKVRATAGNNDLGGRNIDRRMQDWALQKIRKRLQNPSYQLTADDVDELSSAKIDLSSKGKNDAVTFQLAALEDETLTITNEMLADMCEAEMDALLQVMAKVTDVLLMEEVQVQRVLYVGGSSHLVMVQDLTRSYLSDMFPGVEFVIPAHRDLAVAEGAALYALSDSEISGSRLAISMPKVVDVTTRDIGVRICEDGDDDVMRVIVPRYSEFRQRGAGSCDFFNVGEGNRILFQVYEGNRAKASENVLLYDFHVTGPRDKYEPEEMTVEVTMYIDMDGIVHVTSDPTGKLKDDIKKLGAVGGATGSAKYTISRIDPTGLAVKADQLRERMLQQRAAMSEAVARAELKAQIKEECTKLLQMGQPQPDVDDAASKVMLEVKLKEVQAAVTAAEAAAAAAAVADCAKRAADQAVDGDAERGQQKVVMERAPAKKSRMDLV